MELVKKKAFWYTVITLLVFFTDIWVYFYLKNPSLPVSNATTEIQSSLAGPDVPNEAKLNAFAQKDMNTTVVQPIISDDPNSELEKIKHRATHLTKEEIKKLTQDAVNQQIHQDKRFESVFLLSHHGHATLDLKKIIDVPISQEGDQQKILFENILRAQAIEGIENGQNKALSRQIIQDLILKTDNVFLLDRLERAKNSIDGRANSSEVQDNRQLEKIIEN